MLVTATQYRQLATGPNGERLPIGDSISGHEALTGDDSFAAMAAGTTLVRVGTDTAITLTPSGSSAAMFMPANSVEFFAVVAGQTLAVATVA